MTELVAFGGTVTDSASIQTKNPSSFIARKVPYHVESV